MPWTAADAKKHKKGLTSTQSKAWAKIANGALKRCEAKGQGDCEGRAIRIANSAVDRVKEIDEVTDEIIKELDLMLESDSVLVESDEETKETALKGYIPFGSGITSFKALDEYRAAQEAAEHVYDTASDFMGLVREIVSSPGVKDKGAAIKSLAGEFDSRMKDGSTKETDEEEDSEEKAAPTKKVAGKNHPRGDFLIVEDPNDPQTWHLPVKTNGKPDRGLAGGAHGALFSTHRGNPYKGPRKEEAKRKLKAFYKAQGWDWPEEKKEVEENIITKVINAFESSLRSVFSVKEQDDEESFMVWKEADGSIQWIARYSNNFRDEDNPPEIISAKSHERFSEMVDKGLAPLPQLWLWHVPEWKFGEAKWVAYDDSGFALAGGAIDKGCEPVAEWLSKQKGVRVSHGMPRSSIKRDPDDDSVIVEHITKEISPLPVWAAANKITGFAILGSEGDEIANETKEDEMIPKNKVDVLINNWGLNPELLDGLQRKNEADANELKKEGVENKEATEEVEETSAEEVAETQEEEPKDENEEPKDENDVLNEAPTRKEVADAFETVVKPYVTNQDALVEVVKGLAERLEALEKSDDEKVKDRVEGLPRATVSSILAQRWRAVGSEEAAVDGRTSLAKSKPKEAQSPSDGPLPVPGLNRLLHGQSYFAEAKEE